MGDLADEFNPFCKKEEGIYLSSADPFPEKNGNKDKKNDWDLFFIYKIFETDYKSVPAKKF